MKKAKEIIERVRKHHENVEVIGPGRGVSVIAHQELHSSKSVKYAQITVPKGRSKLTFPEAGERRFGRPHLLQQIEKVTNKSVDGSFLAPGFNPSGATPVEAAKNIEALAELKKRILKHIVDAPPGHTFLFDGHGGAKAFGIGYLQNPSAKATESTKKCSLTVEDMVSALKKRYEKHKDHHELLATDVFIFNSCVSGTFIELIREQLHFPQDAFILISAAEKGLLTKSDFNSQTGDALWDDVLGLKDENPKAVKLGDIIQRDRKKVIGSNLRIIVPLSLESEERKGKKSQEPEYLQIGRAELTNSQEEGKKAA